MQPSGTQLNVTRVNHRSPKYLVMRSQKRMSDAIILFLHRFLRSIILNSYEKVPGDATSEEGEWRQELRPAFEATVPLSIRSSRVASFCEINFNLLDFQQFEQQMSPKSGQRGPSGYFLVFPCLFLETFTITPVTIFNNVIITVMIMICHLEFTNLKTSRNFIIRFSQSSFVVYFNLTNNNLC